MKKVALYLAEQGHDVTILCTRRSDANMPFHWHPNLEIVPIFRFKQPFPEPYATEVYNIASAIQDVGDYLDRADVFYSHDGGLIFPYVYQDTPAIISLRSILFSETLQSGFLFQGDGLVVPSQHTVDSWLATVGRFFPELKNRMHVIHNGLDFLEYRPCSFDDLADRLKLEPQRYQYILYPHRPDDAKGIRQTIAVADRLVHQYGLHDIRVLVPQWIDTGLADHVLAYYRSLQEEIAQHGLTDYFVFHDWISDSDMPQYFSLGAVTFALGNYVETFGNTPYESLACGTPVIVASVGPYRDMLPDNLVAKVNYGDAEEAARLAADILQNRQRTSDDTMHWLHENFKQDDMVRTYADVILNARKLGPMPYVHYHLDPGTVAFRLAPWCVVTGDSIYHDFLGTYNDDAQLVRCAIRGQVTAKDCSPDQLMAWYREGYWVPIP
ncbi:MAG: glycosyltransferase family 4 protein [Anaerolineaceae bacterium]|nr:glycosyltransferase family 4 protein [Anaerolineaceae bacterium]